jgi:hypothetical protein
VAGDRVGDDVGLLDPRPRLDRHQLGVTGADAYAE